MVEAVTKTVLKPHYVLLGPSIVILCSVVYGTCYGGLQAQVDRCVSRARARQHSNESEATSDSDSGAARQRSSRSQANPSEIRHVQEECSIRKVRPVLNQFLVQLNHVFATVGPLFPFVLLFALCRFEPSELKPKLVLACKVEAEIFLIFLIVLLFRMVFYLLIYHTVGNYHFSDHLFLVCSMVAQIQIILGMTPWDSRIGKSVIILSGILLILLAVETCVTARYFHIVGASWLAFVIGSILFSGVSVWYLYKKPKDKKKRPAEEALLGNNNALLGNNKAEA